LRGDEPLRAAEAHTSHASVLALPAGALLHGAKRRKRAALTGGVRTRKAHITTRRRTPGKWA